MLEREFQNTVIELALAQGWLVGFTYDSRRSMAGEPDLRLVHKIQKRLIFAELKREKGKITKGRPNRKGTWLTGQDEWAEALEAVPGVEYYFWQPHHWDKIVEILGTP